MKEQINTQEIALVAACLGDHFLNKIYELSPFGYIGSLDIVAQWAMEYYEKYYELQKDWDSFIDSKENKYKADCWDDFLYAWRQEKLTTFFNQH